MVYSYIISKEVSLCMWASFLFPICAFFSTLACHPFSLCPRVPYISLAPLSIVDTGSCDLSILIGDKVLLTGRGTIVARPLKFYISDRFACMIHHWKAKNLLVPTTCCNINLVKPFGNYALLNTRSATKI